MGLLDRLLKRLQRTEKTPEEIQSGNIALKDILFDWFNANGERLDTFVHSFLNSCIEFYKNDERQKRFLERQPEQAYDHYFNQHAILYLAAKYPDNKRFRLLFDHLMDGGGDTYALKDSLRRLNHTMMLFLKEDKSHWETLMTGDGILKAYHAIYDQRDPHISYLSEMPSILKRLLRPEYAGILESVTGYIAEQDFEDKLYVFNNSLLVGSMKKTEYTSAALALLESHRDKVLEKRYTPAELEVRKKIIKDYSDTILQIPISIVFKTTEYKKRRYLSLKNFPGVLAFLDKYASNKFEVLDYHIYQLGNTHLRKEVQKIQKELAKKMVSEANLTSEQLQTLLKQDFKSNPILVFNELLTPLFRYAFEHEIVDGKMVELFESKLLSCIHFHHDISVFQTAFDLIKDAQRNITNEIEKSVTLEKYNGLYGEVSFDYGWMNLNLQDKKQGERILNQLVVLLNKLFPSSLKGVVKYVQYVTNSQKLATMNLDGEDREFTSDIMLELNEELRWKELGYQFVPILIHKKEPSNQNNKDQTYYRCSMALLNYEQFIWYKEEYLPRYDTDLYSSTLIKNIDYQDKKAPRLASAGDGVEGQEELSFKNDPLWKWFKDDYIGTLGSRENWYPVMDVLMNCKGSTKPNKKWLEEIHAAIATFGKEQYFKELGVLMTASLKESFWYLDNYRTTIKGILWSCSTNANEASLSIIKSIVEATYVKIPGVGPKSAAIGNLGLNALASSGNNTAFGMMNLMRNKSKYQRFIKAIDKALEKFMDSTSGDPEQLADSTIPRFDFSKKERIVKIDDQVSVCYFIKNNKLTKKWIVKDKVVSGTPGFIKQDYRTQEKEVAAEFKRINGIFKQLRDRVKTYWLFDRKWEYPFWLENIYEHPLIQPYLLHMIWSNETQSNTFMTLEGQCVDHQGKEVRIGKEDILSLWHPIESTTEEIKAWQDYIYQQKINQPLRQAYREHYPFSDKEMQQTRSERFSHHFLVSRKLMALANSAAWTFTYEHEGDSWPRKYIKALQMTVHLKCDYNTRDFAIPTKEIYFTSGNSLKLNTKKKEESIPFEKVPKKTLSELCRDIDLFIATTSIANDPELSLKTEDQKCYREDFHKGHFSDNASAKIRKQVIEMIAPSLGLTSEFEKNYLIIKGQKNTYRINLGSGFAQVAGSQQHVNLLPDIQPMKKSKKVHSPIQDDETLYVILAKALFLQADGDVGDA